VPVTNDTNGDYDPRLVRLQDGTFLIAWERNRTPGLADPGFPSAAFLQDLEIAYTVYHPLTGIADPPTFVTNNAYLDHAPKLAVNPSGAVLLTWLANPANKLVGDSGSPDSLMWATWTGSGFSPAAQAFTIAGALSGDLAYGSKEAAEVFWQVNGSAQSDISVAHFDGSSWGAVTPITSDPQEDTAPRLLFTADGNPFLTWRRDGQLVYLAGDWANAFTSVGDATDSASASGEQMALLPDGDVVLAWPGAGPNGPSLEATCGADCGSRAGRRGLGGGRGP